MNQNEALKILQSGANVFLTGEPGSGKTYTINQYVKYLKSHGIEPAVTASTGIAATHIGGMTIHSWSGIGIKNKLSRSELHSIATNRYVAKRIGAANILIIDEISMLGPETLQMIDAICKAVKNNTRPFGGLQVVLVGDFFQLPPVVKNTYAQNSQDEYSQENLFDDDTVPIRFAYDAPVWKQADFATCYITEQYRQDDDDLTWLLSNIRANRFDSTSLELIEQRKVDTLNVPAHVPRLYSHNLDVDRLNDQMLAKIPQESRLFPMKTKGHEALLSVMKKGCLSPENLYLKIGASVMFTKNSPKDGFVNGTLGVVEGFGKETALPIVKLRNGRQIIVNYSDWTIEEDGKVKGMLTQLPLRLAWAITVHKSQGISLDEAVIDLSRVFEFGQGYVALSRVRRLSGIYLIGWNDMAFQVDEDVLKKDRELRFDSTDVANYQLSQEEYTKVHQNFIINCGGQLEISDIILKKKKKPATQAETLTLWQENKDISQIAELRNLSPKTIINHIENLVNKGKIPKRDLIGIIPPAIFRELPKIHHTFKELGHEKLSPVFNHFKGKYTYEDLKLARMIMD